MGKVFKKTMPNRNVVGHEEVLAGLMEVKLGLDEIFKLGAAGDEVNVILSKFALQEKRGFLKQDNFIKANLEIVPGLEDNVLVLHKTLDTLISILSKVTPRTIELAKRNVGEALKVDVAKNYPNEVPLDEAANHDLGVGVNGSSQAGWKPKKK